MRRVRTSPGSEVEFPTSNRSCTAVATLFTFWPPGPEARTNWSWISLSSMEMLVVTGIIGSFCHGWARMYTDFLKSEKPGNERRYRRFNAQNAFSHGHRFEPAGDELVDLVRDETSLGTDGEGHRLICAPGNRFTCRRMGDKGKRFFDDSGQLILHERFEQRPEQYLGQNRVLRLFEAQNQLL